MQHLFVSDLQVIEIALRTLIVAHETIDLQELLRKIQQMTEEERRQSV